TRRWLDKYSEHSIFSSAQNESSFLQLKHAGVGQESSGLFLKAAEDLAAMVSPDQAGATDAAALSALEMAHLHGRVSGRQLGGLGLGVDALRTMPQFAGIKNNTKLLEAVQKTNFSENDILN